MKTEVKQGMRAQYSFERKVSIPGFGLYVVDRKAIFIDANAASMLSIGPEFAGRWMSPRALLRPFGLKVIHKAFAYVRTLKDAKNDPEAALELCMARRLRRGVHNSGLEAPDEEELRIERELQEKHAHQLARIKSAPAEHAPNGWIDTLSSNGLSVNSPAPKTAPTNSGTLSGAPVVAFGTDPFSGKTSTSAMSMHSANAAIDAYDVQRRNQRSTKRSGKSSGDDSFVPSLSGRHSCDSASFAIVLSHGELAGTKLYIKLNALFANSRLSHINVTTTRVASYLFELIPHAVTDSASFDWFVPTGECIFGSNYYELLGYHPNDAKVPFIKRQWQQNVVHPDDVETLRKENILIKSEEVGNSFEFLYRSRCRDGSYIWTKSIGMAVARDNRKHASRILGINIDINRVIQGYEQLQSKVFTDILTGLRNRTYLIAHMEEFIHEATRPLTILFADVTALKAYNDYLGHAVGDRLLCSATIMLQNCMEREHECIRISGDEVVCILQGCDEEEAAVIEKRVEAAVTEYNALAPVRMPVFFSVGTRTIDLTAFAGRKLDEGDRNEAMGMFYQAIQEADSLMQVNKKRNHDEHYKMVRAYIENSLKQKIDMTDKRLFA